jgi:ankyrin repeat protein
MLVADDYKLTNLLLEAGADPNIQNNEGNTALIKIGAKTPKGNYLP